MQILDSLLRKRFLFFLFLIIAGQQVLFYLFQNFHAEDAYILYRYVRNFINGEGLVYNAGEYILALTSPLHALVLSCLSIFNLEPAFMNRILLWATLVFLTFRGVYFLMDSPRKQILFGLSVGLSPFLVFWSLGGLETILIAAVILEFTHASIQAIDQKKTRINIFFLAAIAFLLRYDTAVYTSIIILFLLIKNRVRFDLSILPAVLIVSAWLLFALSYYHNILPTSFFIKTPSFGLSGAINNGIYLIQFWVLSACIVLIQFRLPSHKLTPILAGIIAVFAYGLTCATTHMFFGYRMILPYLPALILFAIIAFDAETKYFMARVIMIIGIHIFVTSWMLQVCIDPRLPFVQADFSPRQRSVEEYHQFMMILDKGGQSIAKHTKSQTRTNKPKVVTFAGGYLPWRVPDAYVYETLISYRSQCPIDRRLYERFASASDYIHIIFPLHGTPEKVLGHPLSHYEIVSSERTILDSKKETVYVLWNQWPVEMELPKYIDGSCQSGEKTSLIKNR
ncbi:MAG: hypothetical protein KA444_07420 [Bacteroidia bacterium]|nr:hypothetical protein [Bacteroidia bacterium]